MSILVDHCVPRKVVRALKTWGYAANPLTDHVAVDTTNAEVMQLAKRLDAVLLTADLDFANVLNYPPQNYAVSS